MKLIEIAIIIGFSYFITWSILRVGTRWQTPKPQQMTKIKVYIIGKVKGLPIEQVKANFQQFEDKINALGYEAVNPMKLGIPETYEFYQCKDICFAALDPCEAVFVLNNWIDSVGSAHEITRASRSGKCIFYEQMYGLDDLAKYIPLQDIEA